MATLAAGEATRVSVPQTALEELRGQMRGQVLTFEELEGSTVRPPFNAMHSDRPAAVIQCTGTADVIAAVNWARDNGFEVAVRGGGHSIAGLSSSDGGIVIDLSPMNGVHIDPAARTARVQGGALWGDVDREAQVFGQATPGGLVSDTGVAGLTLGGGYGWLRRKYGLACDNMIEAQVVSADGQVRTASAQENSDLFWALRGGGGNFGIVTSFTFRLYPVGPIVAFAGLFYPLDQAANLLRGLREFADGAPDEVTVESVTLTMPAAPDLPEAVHNQPCLVVAACYSGDPERGMQALDPLRRLGSPLADISQPMPYTIVQSAFDAFFPRQHLQSYWKALYLPELSDEVIDLIAERAKTRPAPLTFLVVWQMGGAINRVGAEATAFAERSAPYMISIDGNWDDPADNEANVAWVRDRWAELNRFGTGSTYLNFTGISDERTDTGVENAFGRNLVRLAKVKAKYDPDNFFHLNNNVSPHA